MDKQLVNEARALWQRLNIAHTDLDGQRLRNLRYRAWRRYQRRVDALLETNGVGYVDKLSPIFGWRSWRQPEV